MITISALNILGLTLGIIGTIILAISLGRFLKALRIAVTAHEVFIESLTRGDDIVQIAGTDIHVAKGAKKAGKLTVVGIILVVIGFFIQLLQYLPIEWTASFIQR